MTISGSRAGWVRWKRPLKTENLSHSIFDCIDLNVNFFVLCWKLLNLIRRGWYRMSGVSTQAGVNFAPLLFRSLDPAVPRSKCKTHGKRCWPVFLIPTHRPSKLGAAPKIKNPPHLESGIWCLEFALRLGLTSLHFCSARWPQPSQGPNAKPTASGAGLFFYFLRTAQASLALLRK